MILRAAIALMLMATPVYGEVVRIDVTSRADLLAGRAFGSTGPYEKVSGTIHFEIVDARDLVGVGAGREQDVHGGEVAVRSSDVERRVVVHTTLGDVRAAGEEQLHDFVGVGSGRRSRPRDGRRQGSDEGRKAVAIVAFRIGAGVEQRAHEGYGAVVDGVRQTPADGRVGHDIGEAWEGADLRSKRHHVARADCRVKALVPRAVVGFGHSGSL